MVGGSIDRQLVLDVVVAVTLGYVTNPLMEMIMCRGVPCKNHLSSSKASFSDTFLYGAADSIRVTARIYSLTIILHELNRRYFHIALPVAGGEGGTGAGGDPTSEEIRATAQHLAFIIWTALAASTIKHTLFMQAIVGHRLGRVALYDKLIDFCIGMVTVTAVLDALNMDVSFGLQSILAGSGVGALVFSLASKDLAQQVVSGFVVQAWDAFEVGETIKLGDGTEGRILKIGLVETEIMGYDNISIKIPNAQIVTQRISNLSRMEKSQVKQELRFKLTDMDKIPKVLVDVKEEIRAQCPELISNGTKPFRALLCKYEADHVRALVNCHFNIPPSTTAYYETQHQVLLAIASALKQNRVEHALPATIYYQNNPHVTTGPTREETEDDLDEQEFTRKGSTRAVS